MEDSQLPYWFLRVQKFAIHFALGSFGMIKYLEFNKDKFGDSNFYSNSYLALNVILIFSGVLAGKYVIDGFVEKFLTKNK